MLLYWPKQVLSLYVCHHNLAQVHDLHIWGMSTTEVALTAHLVKQSPEDDDALIAEMKQELHRRFGIEHITIQWERGGQFLCENGCKI